MQTAVTPLGIRAESNTTPEQDTMLTRIERFDLEFVRDRIIDKRLLPVEQVMMIENEFRRYAALCALMTRGSKLPMISPHVDEYWHTFILFTREYAKFCATAIGRFIHHSPRRRGVLYDKSDIAAFVDAYTHYFGELPQVWKDGLVRFLECSGGDSCDPIPDND